MLYEEAEKRARNVFAGARHEPRLEPMEPARKAIGDCAQCKEDVFADEDHYNVEGLVIHNDCIRKYRRWAD